MKDALKVVGAIVLIGLAVFLFKRSSDQAKESQDFPDGVYYLCGDCKHEFNMSRDELADWSNANPGKTIPCPQCNKNNNVRAEKCPLEDCGRLFPIGRDGGMVLIAGKVSCPICKQPLP